MEKIWYESYVPGVPRSLEIEEVTLPESLSRTAGRFPDNRALIFQGTVVTYRELEQMVAKFASALVALGVKPGSRVSLVMPNLIQTVVGIYGALTAGATVVMHNPTADNMSLAYQFNDAQSDLLISLDVLVPRMIELRRRTGITKIVSCHIRDYLPFLKRKLFAVVKGELHLNTPEAREVYEFTDLLESDYPKHQSLQFQMDDTAFILYTSATTGVSKGVELSHRNLFSNVQQLRRWFPGFRDGHESVVGCLPFFHSFGLTCALNVSIFYGYCNILIPLPDPKNILEAIDSEQVTFIPALPTFYNSAINDPSLTKCDFSRVKGCFSGGAPLPLQTIRTFEELTGAQICEGYGLTESSPVTHINPLGGETKVGTIGLPLPGTDAKIVDLNDFTRDITDPDVPGELCIKGPQIMKGYINLPKETEQSLKDGWLLTGDICSLDGQGYFRVVDRKKDVIMVNETPVFPRQVEEVLFAHEEVVDACVAGILDQDRVERVAAFVVVKDQGKVTQEEIVRHCRTNLAGYQVPAQVEFLDELPRSPVGKTLRKEVKRLHMIRQSRPVKTD
jgi:long-chain acyl-CoA synthetase